MLESPARNSGSPSVTARHDAQRSQACTKTGLVYPWRCPHVKRRMNKHKWHRQPDASGETVDRWSLGRETRWLRNGRRRPPHVRRCQQGRRDGRAGWWRECPSWKIGFPVHSQRGDPTGLAYFPSQQFTGSLSLSTHFDLSSNARALAVLPYVCVMDHSSSCLPEPATIVHRWFSQEISVRLDRDLRHRGSSMTCHLHDVFSDVVSDILHPTGENPVYSCNLPSSTLRLCILTRWRHDHSSTDRPARDPNGCSTCPFCHSADEPLLHHLSACSTHSVTRAARGHSCSISLTDAVTRHDWIFVSLDDANTT